MMGGGATYFDLLHAKQSPRLLGIVLLQLLDLGGALFDALLQLTFDGLCSYSLCRRVLDVSLCGNGSSLVVGKGAAQLLAVSFVADPFEHLKVEL
jgi:hypothetical protein